MFKELQSKQNETAPIATDNEERNNNVKKHLLVLSYKGSDAIHIISSMCKQVNRALPDDVKMTVSYTAKELSTCVNVKDKTIFNHEHDIAYYAQCPKKSCPHDHVGESGRRVLEQVKDYNGRDTSSHIFKHCVADDHQFIFCDDLKVVGRNYPNNKRKRKIAEALLIKNLKPSLNVQEKSVSLRLFNRLRSLEPPIPMNLNCIYVAMTPFSFKL